MKRWIKLIWVSFVVCVFSASNVSCTDYKQTSVDLNAISFKKNDCKLYINDDAGFKYYLNQAVDALNNFTNGIKLNYWSDVYVNLFSLNNKEITDQTYKDIFSPELQIIVEFSSAINTNHATGSCSVVFKLETPPPPVAIKSAILDKTNQVITVTFNNRLDEIIAKDFDVINESYNSIPIVLPIYFKDNTNKIVVIRLKDPELDQVFLIYQKTQYKITHIQPSITSGIYDADKCKITINFNSQVASIYTSEFVLNLELSNQILYLLSCSLNNDGKSADLLLFLGGKVINENILIRFLDNDPILIYFKI